MRAPTLLAFVLFAAAAVDASAAPLNDAERDVAVVEGSAWPWDEWEVLRDYVLDFQLPFYFGDEWQTVIYFTDGAQGFEGNFIFYRGLCRAADGLNLGGSGCGRTLTGYVNGNLLADTSPAFDPGFLEQLASEVLGEFGARLSVSLPPGVCEADSGSFCLDLLGSRNERWSFFFDTGGSVMGGNKIRDLGGGVFETLRPERHYADIDLYLWGLLAPEALGDMFFVNQVVEIDQEEIDRFSGGRDGVRIVGHREDITFQNILDGTGLRSPAFPDAPLAVRHLFVIVARPGDCGAGTGTPPEQIDFEKIVRLRREWTRFFYETTRFLGRALTTVDGLDDLPYWEFERDCVGTDDAPPTCPYSGGTSCVLPCDDPRVVEGWTASGLAEPLHASGDGALQVVVGSEEPRLDTAVGQVRIDTSQHNTFTIRMSAQAGTEGRVILEDGGEVTFPVIADGRMRTIGVPLTTSEDWTDMIGVDEDGAPLTVPALSVVPVESGATGAVRIERIELVDLPVDPATGLPADEDADGYLDEYDNCEEIPNPDQADYDEDTVGDACDDTDHDGIEDGIDNCPTTPNFTQSDEDNDSLGDLCDSDYSPTTGCSISTGGSAPPDVVVVVVVVVGVVVLAPRRRRR